MPYLVVNWAKKPPPKRFINDSECEEHHAIIPTAKKAVLGALSEQELKLYDLICRTFLAMWFKDKITAHTHIYMQVLLPPLSTPTLPLLLHAQGKQRIQDGFTSLMDFAPMGKGIYPLQVTESPRHQPATSSFSSGIHCYPI